MVKAIAKICRGQDGAIFNGLLFRFGSKGQCSVYDLDRLGTDAELTPIAEFVLDKADLFVPHSNSVVFGCEYYSEGDEFPLLYTNVYNNYRRSENRHCGECCVYRILREGESFRSTLVQRLRIGFTEDKTLWRSSDGTDDVRPYGNFVIDRENRLLYAFVMRDGDRVTTYLAFKLPTLDQGTPCELGVSEAVLTPEDVIDRFDTPYHNYIQGAAFHGGRIYSVEGIRENTPPALRIIDPRLKRQIFHFDFFAYGYTEEAELIDFYNGKCLYADNPGNLFELDLPYTGDDL
ncbi:MAG: hypothetical protein IKM04_06225 [Clostridia bacterium]|nr:hypothetical protein [Clostridia bacterium]